MRDKNLEFSNFGSQNNHIHDYHKEHANFRICQMFLDWWPKLFSHPIDGSSISTIGLTIEFGQGMFFKSNPFWCLKFFNRSIFQSPNWVTKKNWLLPNFLLLPKKILIFTQNVVLIGIPQKIYMINNGLISTIHYYKTWFFKKFKLTN